MEEQMGPTVESTQIGADGPVAPVEQNEVAVVNSMEETTQALVDVAANTVEEEDTEEWSSTDAFNVYNPWLGTKFNTGLNKEINPDEKTWDPENTEWVQKLSMTEKKAISSANSEEYAVEIMARRTLYNESKKKLDADTSWKPVIAGLGSSLLDPFLPIPVGVTANATKSAYTLGAKFTRLATISGESAIVGMAANTAANAAEKGSGLNGYDYGMSNLLVGLVAGGLPVLGSAFGNGLSSVKLAKGMTSDPKNFALALGEITADKVGGTQLRTKFTGMLNKVGLSSDVTFTASSNNEMVTLVSNRIDSPPIAVVDRNTGKPVALGTTGQDYKLKFNGRQRMLNSDLRGLQYDSSIPTMEAYNLEVGKVVRARAAEQEQALYKDLEDAVAFTESEYKAQAKIDKDDFMHTWKEDPATLPQRNSSTDYLNKIPGQSGEGVGPVRKRNYISRDEYSKQVDTGKTVQKEEGDDLLSELLNDLVDDADVGKPIMETQYFKYTPEEKIQNQKMLDTEWNNFKEDISTNGMKEPVIVDYREGKLVVAEGNHRITAANELGIDTPIHYTDNVPNELKFKQVDGVEPTYQNRTKPEIKKFDEEAKLKMDEEMAKAIEIKKNELYDSHQFEFKHADPKVVEGAKITDKYWQDVLEEGHRLKIDGLKNIKGNRHYMTRIFDFQKVREMDHSVLVSKISQGLKSHAANISAKAEDIAKAATDIATKLKDLDYTRDYADYSFFVPKEIGSTAFTRSKKFKMDDRAIQDILVTDIEDVVGQYSYSQAGHFSANHAFPELQGIPREQQMDVFQETIVKPMAESGAPAKEVKALQNMFEDMLGTYRIAKDSNSAVWKGTRIMNSINSLTYGGAFALNTASELGGLLLDGHVFNAMKTRLGTLKEIGTMFNGKGIDDPLARDFVLMGQFENLFSTHNMLKMSDTDTVFNAGKVEHGLNEANEAFFKYNGLRGATVALEAMVGPKVIHDIMDIGAKGSMSLRQQKYMARIGLNPEDVLALSNKLNEVGEFTKSGKIYDMHLDKFDDALLDKMTTAVERGMRHTVIRGDTTYLPSWMIKPNAFNRLAFQFLRYPMAATETLMARGLDENAARWVAATGTSAFMMGMVMYSREQAAIQMGLVNELDAKYSNFWDDDEKARKMFYSAFSKAGTLGGSSIVLDKLSALSGAPTPGSEYVHPDVLSSLLGPTFSRAPQLRNLIEPMLTEGRMDSKKSWNSIMGMTPGATAPIVSEWLRYQMGENTY